MLTRPMNALTRSHLRPLSVILGGLTLATAGACLGKRAGEEYDPARPGPQESAARMASTVAPVVASVAPLTGKRGVVAGDAAGAIGGELQTRIDQVERTVANLEARGIKPTAGFVDALYGAAFAGGTLVGAAGVFFKARGGTAPATESTK